jgi:hypothetical protein
MKAVAEAPPSCSLCGGNSGTLIDGAHVLCRARAQKGLPTPNLGEWCPRCQGRGRIPRSRCGPINPNQAAINSWAPPCKHCGGRGYTKGAVLGDL